MDRHLVQRVFSADMDMYTVNVRIEKLMGLERLCARILESLPPRPPNEVVLKSTIYSDKVRTPQLN